MWLDLHKRYHLLRFDPAESVHRWRADVRACNDDGAEFTVGRLLADQIDYYDAEEWGHNPFDAADADSDGLVSAYSLLHSSEDAQVLHANLVYLYRYILHDDFSAWKLAVLDGFCRQFECETVIVTQPSTIWLSEAEFERVGFGPIEDVLSDRLPSLKHPAPSLIARDMTMNVPIKIDDYPDEAPTASSSHEEWVERELPAGATFY